MPTATEVHAYELVARQRVMSRVVENLRNHRTLCLGILYVITIIAVLAAVARL